MRMLRPCFTLFAVFALPALAQAVPTQVNFTARMVESGAPVQGTRDFVFKLFPTLAGGTEAWMETRGAVPVVDGTVNVDLGASTPLTSAIFDGQMLYLEVTVGGVVLSPRTAVLSVPYALRSDVAAQVGTLTPAQIQQRVTSTCGAGAAIQTINADGTVVCQAVGANDAGVTSITNITAGAGLSGGGSTGSVSLAVNFGGSGSATTVGRSDHNHSGVYLPLGPVMACGGTDKVVGINQTSGSVVCAADSNSGGTVTAVNVTSPLTSTGGTSPTIGLGVVPVANGGAGASLAATGGPGQVVRQSTAGGALTVSALTGADLPSTVQNWASQPTCPAGQFLGGISSAGAPTCVALPQFGAVWSGNCTAAVGTACTMPVPATYAVGSSAGTVTLGHGAIGSYTVTFPWISTGVPVVTYYGGSGSITCRVNSWGSNPMSVNVGCANGATATDALFTVSVMGN